MRTSAPRRSDAMPASRCATQFWTGGNCMSNAMDTSRSNAPSTKAPPHRSMLLIQRKMVPTVGMPLVLRASEQLTGLWPKVAGDPMPNGKPLVILGIESSCDDTAAAVLVDGVVRSNVVAGQEVHGSWGGVVPELASRAHQEHIVPVVHEALRVAGLSKTDLD